MERRGRSRLEVWLPVGYLVLVLVVQVWVEVVSRTGEVWFARVWSLLLTAPFSFVVADVFLDGPGALVVPEALLRTGLEPASAPVGEWVDPSAFGSLGSGGTWGFYAALLVGALLNAAAIWGLVRVLLSAGRRLASRRAEQHPSA
ncbi:SCO4225 family membrane protein [Streptomyces sp. NPDC099050]|uniref:SCO4225 family membrane protein n=1 Tax=Streptomyces sp. NPDC099050 TaxID=3366100 RepID=UPI00380BBDFC